MNRLIEVELFGGPADGLQARILQGVHTIEVPIAPALGAELHEGDGPPLLPAIESALYQRCPRNRHRFIYRNTMKGRGQ